MIDDYGGKFIWIYMPAIIITLILMSALSIFVRSFGMFLGFFIACMILLSVSSWYISEGGPDFGEED